MAERMEVLTHMSTDWYQMYTVDKHDYMPRGME